MVVVAEHQIVVDDHRADLRGAEAINADGIAAEATATRRGGGQYAELADLFCATEICPVIIDNDLVLRDDNHVTTTYARRLEPLFATLVRQSLSPSS